MEWLSPNIIILMVDTAMLVDASHVPRDRDPGLSGAALLSILLFLRALRPGPYPRLAVLLSCLLVVLSIAGDHQWIDSKNSWWFGIFCLTGVLLLLMERIARLFQKWFRANPN